MKIPAAITALLALLLALAPIAKTQAQDAPAQGASFDLFYNNLADDGDWYNTPEYGYVWQPYIAYKTDKWRPYTDGYWAQTDDGWTWVSYESFGWATYHYGRWTRLKDIGWAWVPGYDWGPGWVSWRTNDDYVGWAPLPPQQEQVADVNVSTPVGSISVDYNNVEDVNAGYTPAVDARFDIGPDNYCFVESRHFGAPVLSEVLLPPQQNFTYIQSTVNVTNIYYGHQDNRTVVYNRGGPSFDFISTRVDQPIQRLRLERRDDPNYLRGGNNHGGGFNPTQVHDGVLQVAAPMIAHRPMNFQQMKPARLKGTLPKAEVVHGWTGVNADPQAIAQERAKIQERAKAVPARQANGNIAMPPNPASHAPAPAAENPERKAAAAPAPSNVNPAAPGAPHQPLTDAEKQARRDAAQQQRQQHPNAGAPQPFESAAKPNEPAAKPNEPAAAHEPAAPTDAERAARKAARQQGRPAEANAPAAPEAAAPTEEERAARKAARQQEQPAKPAEQPAAAAPTEEERAARKAARQQEQPAKPAEQPAAATPTEEERAARKAARQQEQPARPAEQPAAAAPTEEERAARKAARQQQQQDHAPAPKPAGVATPSDEERAARKAARQQERGGPKGTPARDEHPGQPNQPNQ